MAKAYQLHYLTFWPAADQQQATTRQAAREEFLGAKIKALWMLRNFVYKVCPKKQQKKIYHNYQKCFSTGNLLRLAKRLPACQKYQ